MLGYRLQYVYQEIDGYNGWVYDDITTPPDNDPEPPNTPDGQPELWYQSGTGIVLTYWVLWNIPTAGLSVSLQPGPSVSVRLEAGAAGLLGKVAVLR